MNGGGSEPAIGGRIQVRPATLDDEAEMRALLRARGPKSWVALAMTREPSVRDAASAEGERHHGWVVRDGSGRLLGMGSRSVRRVFVAGRPALLGYLGQLRTARGVLGGKTLREVYRQIEETRRADELPFDLTSIVGDADGQGPAQRLLEAGLAGMPRYDRIGGLVTLVISTRDGLLRRRRPRWMRAVRPARVPDRSAIAAFLEAEMQLRPFAPAWDWFGRRDLGVEDFVVFEADGEIRGVGGCWDQRAFKQVRLLGYALALGVLRPALSPILDLAGRPRLPPPGRCLELGYAAPLVATADDPDVTGALLEALRARGRARGLDLLALSLPEAHPCRTILSRRFRAFEYRSTLYAVRARPLSPDIATFLRGRPLYVEAATL